MTLSVPAIKSRMATKAARPAPLIWIPFLVGTPFPGRPSECRPSSIARSVGSAERFVKLSAFLISTPKAETPLEAARRRDTCRTRRDRPRVASFLERAPHAREHREGHPCCQALSSRGCGEGQGGEEGHFPLFARRLGAGTRQSWSARGPCRAGPGPRSGAGPRPLRAHARLRLHL